MFEILKIQNRDAEIFRYNVSTDATELAIENVNNDLLQNFDQNFIICNIIF